MRTKNNRIIDRYIFKEATFEVKGAPTQILNKYQNISLLYPSTRPYSWYIRRSNSVGPFNVHMTLNIAWS
jgi:hypothetical protein